MALISIVVKNDANQVVSQVQLTTNNAVLTALNQWRLKQILSPEQLGVLRYPTTESFLKSLISDPIKTILQDYYDAIKLEKGKIEAANLAIKNLKDAALL